jgi:hypothetical protein
VDEVRSQLPSYCEDIQALPTPESSLRRDTQQIVMQSELDLLIQQICRDIQALEDTLQQKDKSAPNTHTPLSEQDQQAQVLWRKLYTDPDEM